MITLIQDQQDLCPVTQFQYHEGHREVNTVGNIGGQPINMPGRQTPDTITFVCPVMPRIDSTHQLRDDDHGDTVGITITTVTAVGPNLFVVAAIPR